MAGLSPVDLPAGWEHARGNEYRRHGVTLTWRPSADAACTLGVGPSRSRRVRCLWLFMHGWRSFLLYKEGQTIRHEFAERLLGELSGRPDGGRVMAQLKELKARGLLPA